MATVNEKMTAIAENIRHYTGQEEKMSLDDMATNIEDVYKQGETSGKKAEYDEFWDNYQENGNRRSHIMVFAGHAWNDTNFRPKYSMKPSNASNMFNTSAIQNLKGILEERGLVIDFSVCGVLNGAFTYSTITSIPTVSTISCGNLVNLFSWAQQLHTIEKLILKSDGKQTFTSAFLQCTALSNIFIEGVIGQDLDIRYSPLSKASITSIVEHLADTATGKTLTLKKTAKEAAFTDEEWAALAGTKTSWTISLI